MTIPTERWKIWEDKVADGKFRLRRWLGSSDHSAVFVTERDGANPPQSVIKFIAAENLDVNAQLSLWAEAAKLSHPHLIRLFAYGRCTIDTTPLLYVVMEYAEENLAEIIPVRPLSEDEALQMLQPAAEALAFLQRSGFVHSRIRPSNIMAVEERLKLSCDNICRPGRARGVPVTMYDAPEAGVSGFTPASDIWSLGATLLSVVTQKETSLSAEQARDGTLQRVPERLRGIVGLCLQVDPAKRPTADRILQELPGQRVRKEPAMNASAYTQASQDRTSQSRPKRRFMLPILVLAAVFAAIFIGSKFSGHESSRPARQAQPEGSQANNPNANSSPAPLPKPSPQPGVVRGSVLNQVMPQVSSSALHTVTGRIKVTVEVVVDTAGNVSGARIKSSGPSRYFSTRALAAARQWKFNPGQVNGEPVASEWLLRFQFARTSVQASSTELKP
jgi:TonB family protein